MTAQEPLDLQSPAAGEIALALDARQAKAPLTGGFNFVLFIIVAVALAISFGPAEMGKASLLVTDADKMGTYLSGFLRPDFDQWELYLQEIIVTVQIALWGTFLAVAAAIPFGLLAARNVAPTWIVQPVRRLMDLFRSINELVIATIFIVAVGLGPFAGVLGIMLHTAGTAAKFFADQIESTDLGPHDAIRATGAGRLTALTYGLLPDILPLLLSTSLFWLEFNVRASTVLGVVGAGGIGQELKNSMDLLDFSRLFTIIAVILIVVTALDWLSGWLRKRLV